MAEEKKIPSLEEQVFGRFADVLKGELSVSKLVEGAKELQDLTVVKSEGNVSRLHPVSDAEVRSVLNILFLEKEAEKAGKRINPLEKAQVLARLVSTLQRSILGSYAAVAFEAPTNRQELAKQDALAGSGYDTFFGESVYRLGG